MQATAVELLHNINIIALLLLLILLYFCFLDFFWKPKEKVQLYLLVRKQPALEREDKWVIKLAHTHTPVDLWKKRERERRKVTYRKSMQRDSSVLSTQRWKIWQPA